ncbi:MAG: ribonuclease HI [Synergistaceae bacterium]|nr:ribonuclease HI [Synergistaceae bacterium]MBQ6737405.1 ribonuclease HI [Synergistaceae bacterium]MBQ7067973.1 ribonuclease HI [Synergistaceae bacterium]MBR0076470.1 ribonuclease HI [Synergistaceae bacterium]MBR0078806.1 ribonuclease HI [Synergistaceae bacterium]
MSHVIIYTDGGSSPNPGKGGWAAILFSPEHNLKKEIYGHESNTTNNRMELTAAIKALEALKFPCEVDLFTDSSYLQNAFVKKWLVNWQKNGWKNSNKGSVLNRDLWEKLLTLTKIHKVNWHWVKGHADNEMNNRCDELVCKARNEI